MNASTPSYFTVLDQAPDHLFTTPADKLHELLHGPTLVHLPGPKKPSLLISVLLHGNETSGWSALCNLMQQVKPERDIYLFIGNVAAAAQTLRSLPDQPDFNRIWKDTAGPAGELAIGLLTVLFDLPEAPLAAVDFHNNTGRNPSYCVVTDLAVPNLQLAALLSDTAVLVEEPDSVLTRALTPLCPSVAVEVGPINDPNSEYRALNMLHALMNVERVEEIPTNTQQLLRTIARVHIQPDVSFDFADEHKAQVDLTLTAGIEAVNFHSLPTGTDFGSVSSHMTECIRVLDPHHRDVTHEFFNQVEGRLLLNRSVIPAMYTTDQTVVRQDCLCYFMEPLEETSAPGNEV